MLASHNWGSDQELLLKTYQGLIRSKIDYGCILYNSAKPHILKMIDPIHNVTLRLAMGLFRTCPISSVLFEAGEMSLEQRRKYLSIKYALRISSTPNNPTYHYIFDNRYHELYTKKLKLPSPLYVTIKKYLPSISTQKVIIIERKQDKIPPWRTKTPEIDTILADCNKNLKSNLEHKTKFLELNRKYTFCKKFFTDASKSKQGVGYAIITDDNIIKKRLPTQTSIFTAKAYTVYDAIKHIYTSVSQDHAIYTDSMSVIQALTNTAKRNKNEIIRNTLIFYTELISNNKKISITWIPLHQGITENEQADLRAKEATTLQTEQHPTPIPLQEMIHYEKEKIKEEWNNIWKSKPTKIHSVITNFSQDIPRGHMSRKFLLRSPTHSTPVFV